MSKPFKTQLQEASQREGHALPRYESFSLGPAHALKWRATVHVWAGMFFDSELNEHPTIKAAEADAAHVALRELNLLPRDLHRELTEVCELLEVSVDAAKTRLVEIIKSL